MSDNISKAIVDMIAEEVILEHLLKSEFYKNDKIDLSNQVNEMPSFEKGDFEKEKVFCNAKISNNGLNELGDGWKTEKVLERDGVKRYIKDDENNTAVEEAEKIIIKNKQDQANWTKHECLAASFHVEEECSSTSDKQDQANWTKHEKVNANILVEEECSSTSDKQDQVNWTKHEKVNANILVEEDCFITSHEQIKSMRQNMKMLPQKLLLANQNQFKILTFSDPTGSRLAV